MSDRQWSREQLHRDGYVLLRQIIPEPWLNDLRDAFDANVRPSDQWPVPRDSTWRFSMVDLEPRTQSLCRLPELLETVGELIGERFFLAQVEGREPLAGCGHQTLHRDLMMTRPGDNVIVIAYLDDFGPDNGATRIVPGTHRPQADEPPFNLLDESGSVQLKGCAGDLLVFDADLVHAGSLNVSGKRRRTLLCGYFAEPLYALHQSTAPLRNVRMDTRERFSTDGILVE